jgi:pilus assembly protein Flp/PilA
MGKMLKKLRQSEDGATAIEYGLIAALIAVVLIGSLTSLGGNVNKTFSSISNKISTSNSR